MRGNTVADHLVDGGANGFGKSFVVKGGGDGLLHINDMVVANLIQFSGADPRFDVLANHIQHICGKTASDAHFFQLFGGSDLNGHGFYI